MIGFPRAFGESRSEEANQRYGQRRPAKAYTALRKIRPSPSLPALWALGGLNEELVVYRGVMVARMLGARRKRRLYFLKCG